MIWIGLRDVATRSEDGSDRAVPWFYRNFVRLPTTTWMEVHRRMLTNSRSQAGYRIHLRLEGISHGPYRC